MRIILSIIAICYSVAVFGQGQPPSSLQGNPDRNGVLIAKKAYWDRNKQDTLYQYVHSILPADSLFINGQWHYSGDTVDLGSDLDTIVGNEFGNVLISNDSLFYRPMPDSAYVFKGKLNRPDSLYAEYPFGPTGIIYLRDGEGSVEFDPSPFNEMQNIEGYETTVGSSSISPHNQKRINISTIPKSGFFIPPDYFFNNDDSNYNELGESFVRNDSLLYMRCQECDEYLVSIIDTSNTNEYGNITISSDSIFYQACPTCPVEFKFELPEVPTPDGSETIVTEGTGIDVIGSGTVGDPYVVTSTVQDSTTVTDGTTIDFTMTGNDVTAEVIDSSITPEKLDRPYVDSTAFKKQNLETVLTDAVSKGYRTGDIALGPKSRYENTGATLLVKGETGTTALEIKPDSSANGMTYIKLNTKTLQEYDYPNIEHTISEFDINDNMDAPNMVYKFGYNPGSLPPSGQVSLFHSMEYAYNLNQASPVADTVIEAHLEFITPPAFGTSTQRLYSWAATWNGLRTDYSYVGSLIKNKDEHDNVLTQTDHRNQSYSIQRWANGLNLISDNASYPVTISNKTRINGTGYVVNDDGNALRFGQATTNRNDFIFYGRNDQFFRLMNDQNTSGFSLGFNTPGWFQITQLSSGAAFFNAKPGVSNGLITFSSSNVGINQTSPIYNLDVTGNIRATDYSGTGTGLIGKDASGKLVNIGTGTGIGISGGNIVNTLVDTDTDDQTIDSFYLSGNNIRLKLESSSTKLLDASGFYNSSLTLSGTTLQLTDGNGTLSRDLAGILPYGYWSDNSTSLYPTTTTRNVLIGNSSASSTGALEVQKTYSNTSDATIVLNSSIPSLNWRSNYRFTAISGYVNGTTWSLLGAGSAASNPTTQLINVGNTGNVGIPNGSLDVAKTFRAATSSDEVSFNHHTTNPTGVYWYAKIPGGKRTRFEAESGLSYVDFFTPATGSNRNYTFATSYFGAGDFNLLKSSTAGGTPTSVVFSRNDVGLGIAKSGAAYTLDVGGTLRIDNLTGTSTGLIGKTAAGQLVDMGVGTGLTISGGNIINTVTDTDDQNLGSSRTGNDVTLTISDGTGTTFSVANTLTATRVGYGDGSNLITGSANLTYDATNSILSVANNMRVSGLGNIYNDDGNNLNFGATAKQNISTFWGPTTNEIVRLKNNSNTSGYGFYIDATEHWLMKDLSNGAAAITIKKGVSNTLTISTDRLGINQSSPSYNLDVTGNMRLTNRTITGTTIAGFNASGQLGALGFGSGFSIVAGDITYTPVDGSTTNEIQTISKSGNAVSLSLSGGSFNIANDTPADGEVLTWSSGNWIASAAASGANIYNSDGTIPSSTFREVMISAGADLYFTDPSAALNFQLNDHLFAAQINDGSGNYSTHVMTTSYNRLGFDTDNYINFNETGGTISLNGSTGTSGYVLKSGAGSTMTWGLTDNIYSVNGTLAGNRTVTMGTNSLTFTGTNNVTSISPSSSFPIFQNVVSNLGVDYYMANTSTEGGGFTAYNTAASGVYLQASDTYAGHLVGSYSGGTNFKGGVINSSAVIQSWLDSRVQVDAAGIKFTSNGSNGTTGYVWTNTGSGYGEWAVATGGTSYFSDNGTSIYPTTTTRYLLVGGSSAASSGALEVNKTYSNTSDANIVLTSSIPLINWRTSYRFAAGSGYVNSSTWTLLGASTTNSNPTSQLINVTNVGDVEIPNGGLTVGDLAGSGTRMVTATSTGVLGAATIPEITSFTTSGNSITIIEGGVSRGVTAPNLYTVNGSLAGNRTVTMGTNSLTFTGTNNVTTITPSGSFPTFQNVVSGSGVDYYMVNTATEGGGFQAYNTAASGVYLQAADTYAGHLIGSYSGGTNFKGGIINSTDVVQAWLDSRVEVDASGVKIEINGSTGTAGDALLSGGSGTMTYGKPVGTQVNNYSSSNTWTKPTGCKTVTVIVIGGGGGGGSGSYIDNSTHNSGSGGGGGGAGGRSEVTLDCSSITTTVTITVGSGGSGAGGNSTLPSNGSTGTSGGQSSFGSYVKANGGAGGQGGQLSATSSGGAAGLGASCDGGAGGGSTNAASAGTTGAAAKFASGGGNGGAGVTTSSGGGNSTSTPPTLGTTGSVTLLGSGGTGGAAGNSGGSGGSYGGGGGGGGAGRSATHVQGGAGGSGAGGYVQVITHF